MTYSILSCTDQYFSACVMCLERFSRIQIHNNEFEVTIGVVLAKIVDGRVSFASFVATSVARETQSRIFFHTRYSILLLLIVFP